MRALKGARLHSDVLAEREAQVAERHAQRAAELAEKSRLRRLADERQAHDLALAEAEVADAARRAAETHKMQTDQLRQRQQQLADEREEKARSGKELSAAAQRFEAEVASEIAEQKRLAREAEVANVRQLRAKEHDKSTRVAAAEQSVEERRLAYARRNELIAEKRSVIVSETEAAKNAQRQRVFATVSAQLALEDVERAAKAVAAAAVVDERAIREARGAQAKKERLAREVDADRIRQARVKAEAAVRAKAEKAALKAQFDSEAAEHAAAEKDAERLRRQRAAAVAADQRRQAEAARKAEDALRKAERDSERHLHASIIAEDMRVVEHLEAAAQTAAAGSIGTTGAVDPAKPLAVVAHGIKRKLHTQQRS
eukprot:gnl/Ergobibamus_cyprinoides/1075.p1 GENE.gnl/Ergobibamus_cyprinoides/1075~~gnl/Ergobibamus_cyprinoides/1075.p1  ORF type:complete len:371 (+),score=112.01 gnl/Ergobibamus_cyprinoides/1075:2-1114(+)